MTHINQRRDLSTNWEAANPVLQLGEVGWESDTRKSKLGDGVTAWNDLLYSAAGIEATKADVGLDQVDNTADLDKPVSTATQTALATKADAAVTADAIATKAPLASPTFTGDPKAPTPATADNDTSLATTAFVKAQGYATKTGAETLTNKTLASPVITVGALTAKIPLVCTAATRPAGPAVGQEIYESDTKRKYVYSGTRWAQILTANPDTSLPIYTVLDTANQPTLATAWTAEGSGLVQAFLAPESGRVKVTHGAYLFQNTAAKLQEFGYKISGGLTRDPLDNEALKVLGVGALRASTTFVLSGLTAGTSYTLTSAHRTSAGGSAPYMSYRTLLIEVL